MSFPDNRENVRILVIRSDRLGDVILSTPVFEAIKKSFPMAHLTVMVKPSVAPVIRGLNTINDVVIYEDTGRHGGIKGFVRLVKDFHDMEVRIVVALQTNRRIAAALFLAGIRYRVGPLSKLHSFLFYNRGVRQRRSFVEMHEADYNLQLLRRIGVRAGTRSIPTRVHVSAVECARAREWLTGQGWDGKTQLIAIHPGMGGSALNWPESHYVELIILLVKDGRSVLVSAGPNEGSLLNKIRDSLGPYSRNVIFNGGENAGSVETLAGLYSWVSILVAPSTGPLHLAIALNRPVVTFFSPIRVQSAIRWGPYLQDESKAKILTPEIYCGEDFKCKLQMCNYYPCMKSITVTQAFEEVQRLLMQVSDKTKPVGALSE